MTSFNPFSLGIVAEWPHSVIGGIRLRELDWRVFFVTPRLGRSACQDNVSFKCPYSRVERAWSLKSLKSLSSADDQFDTVVRVPPNSKARVTLADELPDDAEGFIVVARRPDFFTCVLPKIEWLLKDMKTWAFEEDDGDFA